MRKLLLCLFLILCVGCGSQDEKESAKYTIYGFDGVSEKGIYHNVNTSIGNIVYFYDFESDQDVPLCAKNNCNHKNENCDAFKLMNYKDDTKMKLSPMYYEDNLYYVYENVIFGTIYLCRSNEDGTNRDEIVKLPEGVLSSGMHYQNKFFYTLNYLEKDEQGNTKGTSNLYKSYIYDFSTNKNIEIEHGKNEQLAFLGTYDDKIYLKKFDMEKHSTNLCVFDEKNQKFKSVLSDDNNKTTFIYNGGIYNLKGQDTVVMTSLETKEIKELLTLKDIKGKANVAQNDIHGIMTVIYFDDDVRQKDRYIDLETKEEIVSDHQVVYKNGKEYIIVDENGIYSKL